MVIFCSVVGRPLTIKALARRGANDDHLPPVLRAGKIWAIITDVNQAAISKGMIYALIEDEIGLGCSVTVDGNVGSAGGKQQECGYQQSHEQPLVAGEGRGPAQAPALPVTLTGKSYLTGTDPGKRE